MTKGNAHPSRPRDVPRGVEPRLRRGLDGAWTWHYRVRWKDPATGRRLSEELDTIEEALDFQAHLRLVRRRGTLEDLSRGEQTLTDFFEQSYWPNDARRNLALNTRKTYLPVWYRHLRPRVGHLQLRQITPPVVQTMREHMEEDGVGAPTIRRAMAILQAVCRYAVVKGAMTSNPAKEVLKPRVSRKLAVVAASPSQIEALTMLVAAGYQRPAGSDRVVEHRPNPRSAMLLELLGYEGFRPEEVLALEDRHIGKGTILIEQVNIDGEIVPGQKVNRPPRSVSLFDVVRTDLARYRLGVRREAMSDACQLLFPRPDGQPWREHDYRNWRRRVFKPAVQASGVPLKRPYDLRHACASLLIRAGWPLADVAEHMGHSVATLARDYAHVIADMRGQPTMPVNDAILAARAARERRAG
jgi:integrase